MGKISQITSYSRIRGVNIVVITPLATTDEILMKDLLGIHDGLPGIGVPRSGNVLDACLVIHDLRGVGSPRIRDLQDIGGPSFSGGKQGEGMFMELELFLFGF